MSQVKIVFGGDLADRFISEIEVFGKSVYKCLDIVEANFQGFRAFLTRAGQAGVYYRVTVGGTPIGEERLGDPIGSAEVTISPVFSGSGGGGTLMKIGLVIGGIALAATGFGAFGAAAGVIGLSASTTGLIGVTLALQGFSGLFNAPKTPKSNEESNASLVMNGQTNTISSGGRVPIVYGREVIVGSQTISAGIHVSTVIFDDSDDSN